MPPRRSDTSAPFKAPPARVEPAKSDANTVQGFTNAPEHEDMSGGTFDDEGIDAELVFSQLHDGDDFWDTLDNDALDKIDAIEKSETSVRNTNAVGGNERAQGPPTNKLETAAIAGERLPLRPNPAHAQKQNAAAQKHTTGDQSKTSPPQINSSKTSGPPSDGPRVGNDANQSNLAGRAPLTRTPTGRFVSKPVPEVSVSDGGNEVSKE